MFRGELVKYMNDLLKVDETPDYPTAVNGLQVEGGAEVTKILTAVDGSVSSCRAAVECGADMLIVHHGIFWPGLRPVTGPLKEKIAPLLAAGISLYSSHLPLDAHPELGNNALLMNLLGLEATERFGDFKGVQIGYQAECDLSLKELKEKLTNGLAKGINDTKVSLVQAGPKKVRRLAVVSGGGASALEEAKEAGIDTFITGECAHHNYLEAEELGMNLLYAGHYATETLGVRALGEHLAEKFGLKNEFFDHPTGL